MNALFFGARSAIADACSRRCEPDSSGRADSLVGRKHRPSFCFATNVLIVAAFLAFTPAARAERAMIVSTAPDSGIAIRLSTDWVQTPRFGFAPVRVQIDNHSTRERTWLAEFQVGNRSFFPGAFTTEESITVPAGQRRETWVYVPVAEPGVIGGGVPASAPPGIPPVVTITTTPTGRKVTRVQTLPSGSITTVESEINTTTGTLTTTTISSSGATSTQNRTTAPMPGRNVVFTIDPDSGRVTSSIRHTASTAPGTVTVVTAPAAATTGGATVKSGPTMPLNLTAEITGPGIVGSGTVSFPFSASPNAMRPVAISPSLERVMREKLSAFVSGDPNLSTIAPAQFPADWRAWSSFSCVLLTTDDYTSLDAARRSALRGWVALGGQLCLSPSTAGDALTEGLGAGIVVTLGEPLESVALHSSPAVSPSETLSSPERLTAIAESVKARREAREKTLTASTSTAPADPTVSTGAANILPSTISLFAPTVGLPDRSLLSLTEAMMPEFLKDNGPNLAWLALFLFVFAGVVGPLNLFVFAPAAKRYRLFFTTPLIALGAAALLVVTIFVQDGLGGSGVRSAVVVLLHGENQAAVFQEQFARTGFLTHRGFDLPGDILMTPLSLDEAPAFGGPANVRSRHEGYADGDWFRNRSRQAQQLRRLTPTRARIERVGLSPKGEPIVQSSLGTTLHGFAYTDDAEVIWQAAELPSGQRVALEKAPSPSPQAQPLTGSPNLQSIVTAAASQKPGHWSARGGATELAPLATLDSIRWQSSDILYTGELEGLSAAMGGQP